MSLLSMSLFFEDPDGARRRAGVSAEDAVEQSTLEPSAEQELCGICFCTAGKRIMPCERYVLSQSNGKSVKHPLFCSDCWREYIHHAVLEGKACLDLRCPAPGCNEAVRPSAVTSLVTGPVLERYRRFAAESLIDDGRGGWCPGQECGRASEEPPMGRKEVHCRCGTLWCFGCRTDAHLPVACEVVRKWEDKNRNEGGDATWIKVNTKFCPKCTNPIEKNGGCMHMTCRKPGGCGHEFCWICMQPWTNHTTCNAIKEHKESELSKAAAKFELMRYAHFYERYLAHHKAEQFAATNQLQDMESVSHMLSSNHGFSVTDLTFLRDAVLQIRSGRRFLKWTYAYGYFSTFTDMQRKFFEFHQAQLEDTLERLSDIMENTRWESFVDESSISNQPFYDQRTRVISLTSVVRDFFSKLQNAIEQNTLFKG